MAGLPPVKAPLTVVGRPGCDRQGTPRPRRALDLREILSATGLLPAGRVVPQALPAQRLRGRRNAVRPAPKGRPDARYRNRGLGIACSVIRRSPPIRHNRKKLPSLPVLY